MMENKIFLILSAFMTVSFFLEVWGIHRIADALGGQ